MNIMTTITVEELEVQCIKTEQSFLHDMTAPGDLSFVAIVPKVKDRSIKKVKIFDDLYGEILINGVHTPTVVMIKCKDVRKFFKKRRGEDTLTPKKVSRLITKFNRRNDENGTGS